MTKAGNPCKSKAMPGTNPPRCRKHEPAALDADEAQRATAKDQFIDAFGQCFDVRKAAAETMYAPSTFENWRYMDPDFEQRWNDAKRVCMDDIEASLYERAVGLQFTEVTRAAIQYKTPDGETITLLDPDGNPAMKTVKTVTKTVFDTKAAEILLRAHDPKTHGNINSPGGAGDALPRVPEHEETIEALMNDPKTRAQLDALLDTDM